MPSTRTGESPSVPPGSPGCAAARGVAAAIWSPRRSGCCALGASCCPAPARRAAGRSPPPDAQSSRRAAVPPAAARSSAAHAAASRARADRGQGRAMTRGVLQAGRLDGAEPTMDAAHVVDAVPQPWLPLDADVQFLPVIATKLPFIGGRFGALGCPPRSGPSPEERKVDWKDIDRVRVPGFAEARRGYDKREVDAFLGRLADWL